jgi:hypothetical protein
VAVARFVPPAWISKTKKLGLIVAVLGIAGEGFAEYFGSRANDVVVEFDDALITASRTEAAKADERAAIAQSTAKGFDSAIAASNAEAKKATERSRDAEALAKKYEAQITTSDARAKEADARAEMARSMEKQNG